MQPYSKEKRSGGNMLYIIFILLTLPLLGLYLYYQTTQVKIERISISSDKIKGNLKILHLSDHHFNKIGRLERKIIAYLQKEEFDILVLTGDYLRNITYIDEFAVFLKRLNLNQPGNTYLYVNRGLGTSGMHFRLRCSPEIALIEIDCS